MSDGINPTDIRRCAERALEFWDLDVSSIVFVAARENAVFRVECADGAGYALRIHRQGYHSLAELESENEWTTALSDAGIDTPRPVPTRAGPAYATVPYGPHGETRQVGLIEWIDGVPLDEAVIDAGAVRFRPMLLTAMAVVVGAGVILFDPIFQGLAISLMAGEVASLLLSRMAVPVLFYLTNRDQVVESQSAVDAAGEGI
jgi:hypothetical protein